MKQYAYTFRAKNDINYTIVASRYEQARCYFLRVFDGFFTVVYNGRYTGAPVRNGTCVNIKP